MAISEFLEPAVKDYAEQAKATYSAPIDTDKFTGRQFVAGQDPMQTQAAALATQGVGSYQPYLQAAQTAQGQGAGALGNAATAVGGLGAIQNQAAGMTGAQAYQPFMSPYQSQVIDATLSEFDKSRLGGQQQIRDQAQTDAYNMATQGVGSYQPYLQAAQTAQTQGAGALGQAATAVGGLGAIQNQAGNIAQGQAGMTGAQAYQPFMSPYQSQVVDATLSEFDKQRLGGQQNIRDAAVNSGNFGGGREGAMMGQYNADSLADRSALQASMLQQGYGQANQLAQQNFQNQGQLFGNQQNLFQMQNQQNLSNQGLAGAYGNQMNQQFGLSDFNRTGMGQDINALGSLGAVNQGYNQAQLTADQQQAQTGAYEPYGRLSQYGNALTGLAGGVAGSQYQEQGQTSPFQTALGTAMGLGGLYGKIFNN